MAGISDSFSSMNISMSALTAQRRRMDVIAGNLANAESTRSTEGGPYQRQQIVFKAVMNEAAGGKDAAPGAGVSVDSVGSDHRAPIKVYMPGHPDADANGIVLMPDVRPAEEMADMVSASRSYEANAAALKIGRMMFQKALDIGRA